MDRDDRRRLERLRDDLDELLEGGVLPIGFGIIALSPRRVVKKRETWKFLAKRLETSGTDGILQLRPNYWIDPAPNGQYCVLWWGNRHGIVAFQEWNRRLLNFFSSNRYVLEDYAVLPPTGSPIKFGADNRSRTRGRPSSNKRSEQVELGPWDHYATQLLLLQRIAAKVPQLSELVLRRLILHVTKKNAESLRGLSELTAEESLPVKVHIDDSGGALWFARAVVSHLLGEPVREPRLAADPNTNTVTLDGVPCRLIPELVLIIEVLLKANGNIVSASSMKRQAPKLQKIERIDRLINRDLKRKCPEIHKVIDPVKRKGYRILPEYLA